MSIGTLAVRGVVGPLMVGHGTQKLFGWFGGPGIDNASGLFEKLGLRPGRRNVIVGGGAEALGGLLLTVGALTPLAASMISGSMVTAMRKVHLEKGPWVTEGGYEYNAVLIASMAMVAAHGPGRPSVDAKVFPNLKGPGWALATVGAAVASSYLIDHFNEQAPEEEDPAPATGGDPVEEARFSKASATSAARS